MNSFGPENLPFGVFDDGRGARVGVALGESVIDLVACPTLKVRRPEALRSGRLNELLAEGKEEALDLRRQLLEQCRNWDPDAPWLVPLSEVSLRLPVEPGDFVDFYSSLHHASNVGTMFRGPEKALPPNWKHLPIGYHGRCSTLMVSDSPVRRPHGQRGPGDFGPSGRLDFELEVGMVICGSTQPGETLKPEQAEEHIFGLVLVNDWSARDLQKWEYQPLGPFLGKSFATTVSPWVVPLEAFSAHRVDGPEQDPKPLSHLAQVAQSHFDIPLEVEWESASGTRRVICRSNHRHLYWSMNQQLCHLTSNGTAIRAGDIYASGTISGPTAEGYGSMLELSWNGSKPLDLGDEERVFLEDGDSIVITGGYPGLGFGECRGKIF